MSFFLIGFFLLAFFNLSYQMDYWSDMGFSFDERRLQTNSALNTSAQTNLALNTSAQTNLALNTSAQTNVTSNITVVCARDLLPCTTRYNSSRICDESTNRWGNARCREDDDCMNGRICSFWEWCQGTPTFNISNCNITVATNSSSNLPGLNQQTQQNITQQQNQQNITQQQNQQNIIQQQNQQNITQQQNQQNITQQQNQQNITQQNQTIVPIGDIKLCNNTNNVTNKQPACTDYLTRICVESKNYNTTCMSDLDCTWGRVCYGGKCLGSSKISIDSNLTCTNQTVFICSKEALPACNSTYNKICDDKRNFAGPFVCTNDQNCTLGRTCTNNLCTGNSSIKLVDCGEKIDACNTGETPPPCTSTTKIRQYCLDDRNKITAGTTITDSPGYCTKHEDCSVGRTCEGLLNAKVASATAPAVTTGTCKGMTLPAIISGGNCNSPK